MTPRGARILVADDEASIRALLVKVLGGEGHEVRAVAGGREACAAAEAEEFSLALLDLTMPDVSGIEVLKVLKERQPAAAVMIMTAYASAESAVEAMKQGALDYLIKPFALDELKLQVRRALAETALARENVALRRVLEQRDGAPSFVGTSPAFRAALDLVGRLADEDATVLITGETGTGKELVARALHASSRRRAAPFLAVNCGAIPEALLERELFGNERGAYTGADAARAGLLEAASDGTLFLDEIADMAPALQAKLLRVLEGHEFLRVGGTRPVRSRVRFVSATNRDLGAEVTAGRFRHDLLHRLRVLTVHLPPLRERGDDVLLLAEHFLARRARETGRPAPALADGARAAMRAYGWPGNVRELRNVVERAVILADGGTLDAATLGLGAAAPGGGGALAPLLALAWREARDAFERAYTQRALDDCGGNVSQAAERMGLDRKNLQDKIRKYNLKA